MIRTGSVTIVVDDEGSSIAVTDVGNAVSILCGNDDGELTGDLLRMLSDTVEMDGDNVMVG